MKISSFTGQYEFLSNFHRQPEPILWLGREWHTVEHAFQSSKSLDPADHARIAGLRYPSHAKRAGRSLPLRPDWNQIREDIMLQLLHLKFSNPTLRDLLLQTGDAELIEGNNWGDTFWGVSGGTGSNKLGNLLMQVRREIAVEHPAA